MEDHPLIWRSLTTLLEEAGFTVVSATAFVEGLAKSADFDVVVCDLHLPSGCSGAAAVELLSQNGWPVLAMSGVATRDMVLDAIAAGARGFVEKSEDPSNFVAAVATVASGGCHISARLAGYLLEDFARRPVANDIRPEHRRLLRALAQGDTIEEILGERGTRERGTAGTEAGELLAAMLGVARRRRRQCRPSPRERQVMRLLACGGLSRKEIGARLNITPWTITSVLENVRDKYVKLHPEAEGIRPSTAAHLWARDLGLCGDSEA